MDDRDLVAPRPGVAHLKEETAGDLLRKRVEGAGQLRIGMFEPPVLGKAAKEVGGLGDAGPFVGFRLPAQVLDDVEPARLQLAEKLQKRAARDGFDWGDTQGPTSKVHEEIAELADASENTREEEAGDLLFAVVNLVRAYGISPENALKAANQKFERRYRSMEKFAEGKFAELSLDEQEALWQRAKAGESIDN